MPAPGAIPDSTRQAGRYFRMTVQPLDSRDHPTAAPASIALTVAMISTIPAGPSQLMGQIPVSYPPRTAKMAVDLVCLVDKTQNAHWVIDGLPKTRTAVDTHSQIVKQVHLPGIFLEGLAAIEPDIDPNADLKLTHARVDSSGWVTSLQYPFDYHMLTGLPAINLALRARGDGTHPKDHFGIAIDSTDSDWMPLHQQQQANIEAQPRRYFEQSGAQPGLFTMYCGPAYSQSLKRLKVSGRFSRRTYRFDLLTLPAADATYDPVFRRYDVRWAAPASATLPSGAKIIALNPWRHLPRARRVPRPDAPAPEGGPFVYVTIAWRPPAKQKNAFMIPVPTPSLENPYSPAGLFAPGHVTIPLPVMKSSVASERGAGAPDDGDPGRPTPFGFTPRQGTSPPADARPFSPPSDPYIQGTLASASGPRLLFADFCLPGSNPVGESTELVSPSTRELENSEFTLYRFAIPVQAIQASGPRPVIHLNALRFSVTVEVEEQQMPFTLVLPFAKRIPQDWKQKPYEMRSYRPDLILAAQQSKNVKRHAMRAGMLNQRFPSTSGSAIAR